jgi:chemotaxis protein CheX
MDVKFINPFLDGTAEVLNKMACIKPIAGKPFAKSHDTAYGDVSGIIGMTGDAIGSLALTFSEKCIIGIVSKMLGESHKEINKEVMDAVGELTNMISGASRKLMEKDNLKVFAAIPTVVFGKAHTVRHVIQGPSIVIPFQTECGDFVIDVCLQSQLRKKEEKPLPDRRETQNTGMFNPKEVNPAVFGKPSIPKAGQAIMQETIENDLGKSAPLEYKDIGERIEHLKKVLAETNANRDSIMKQLKYQPFMEPTQRLRYKKALPAYDTKIKRLKLDIQAAETISRMSQDDFDNPKIKTDYQHHPTRQATSKPDYKK